jgi:hypothetical protein
MIPSQFTHDSRLTLLPTSWLGGRSSNSFSQRSVEGVELREQQQQGSEPREGDVELRRKGRGWWRRTGRAGGEADRGSSRGPEASRSAVAELKQGMAPTLGDQKRSQGMTKNSFILITASARSYQTVSHERFSPCSCQFLSPALCPSLPKNRFRRRLQRLCSCMHRVGPLRHP